MSPDARSSRSLSARHHHEVVVTRWLATLALGFALLLLALAPAA